MEEKEEKMEEVDVRENKMGVEPVPGLLLKMSIPAICSMTLQAFYNIADSVFVSRLSEDALSAVTLVFPIQLMLVAFGVGTGVGINSLIARRLGERNFKDANNAAAHGLFLAACNSIVFAIFGIFFARSFFEWYSDSEELVSMATTYCSIVTTLSVFSFFQVNGEKTLQATGNMIIPMLSHVLGCVINIIFDPILIFGLLGFPALGVAGAAYATVFGQFCGMIAIIICMFKQKSELHITLKGFKLSGRILKDIYEVGFPAMVMQAIQSVAILLLNSILISFSNTAVAVMGAYSRMQSFIFMPVIGLTQGAMPILGYNFGAKNKERFIQALKLTLITALIIMAIGLILFQLVPGLLIGIFKPTAEMEALGITALRLISLCFIPTGAGITFSTLFQSMGHGFYSLFMTLCRQIILLLPFAYILSRLYGITGVWLSYPTSECLSILIAIGMFIHVYKKEIKTMGNDEEAYF